MVFDECLQAVAAENYDRVHELFKRILAGYDFIIQITHNELLYDWHSSNISVVKSDNISKINYKETML